MDRMSHTLSIENVSKHYGTVAALDNVSLQVHRGQFLTLLGPSGSGKTTLLMAIAGFVAADSGRISLDGRPIDHLPPEKRNFGMVFQGYALFPHLSVFENVAFPLRVRRQPRVEIDKKVRQALEIVQLGGLAARMPNQLSGGQQQRAALARALVFEPSLVLLDEPLSALDKNLRSDLQIELKDLHRRVGLTFIYVTHDQQEALSMSDEIAILRDGKLVQRGTPKELYEQPASRFAADFLGRSNFLRGEVESLGSGGFDYRCGAHALTQNGASERPAIGGKVIVTLRPEKIRILGDREASANRVTGKVASWRYLGDDYHILVDVEGVGRLSVMAPTWRREAPAEGTQIVLGWDADASIAVRDD
jgi:putative spermidine/putrescine transport system ATP-binding protein